MERLQTKYTKHIFVCVKERETEECCSKNNSEEIFLKLREHINKNSLMHSFNVSKSLCLGHCLEGPTIVIYPDKIFLRKVSIDDVDGIIKEHLSPHN
jgi:(2Fe-2S) ferredoxin